MFSKKSKKSVKPSRRHISLGIPINIAAGPLGFRAELDTESEGKPSRSCRDPGADRPDSTVTLDEKDARASRIVFHGQKSEDKGLPAPETSTSGAVVGGDEHGDDSTSECL